MIMGPVFRGELLRTARRGRYYLLRFVYGGILLFLVWSGYQERFWGTSTATIAAVAGFAELTFVRFAIVQLVTILLLIPPIFGGSIVDEKQRKTLHYLMASQLSGTEIILDKVLGRLPHLVVFLAMGLPIVSILGLFGGIPLEEVIIAYVGTSSTAVFAVAMTILVSTLARHVRQAILTSYLLMLIWLFVPPVIEPSVRSSAPRLSLDPPGQRMAGELHPVNFWLSSWRRRWSRPGSFVLESPIRWMVELSSAGLSCYS